MQNLRVLFTIGALGLGAAVAAACSSSSNNSTPVADAGNADVVVAQTCSPLGGSLCTPGQGLTCCFPTGQLSPTGTCQAQGSCNGNIQVACENAAGCGTSAPACCADLGGTDAGGLLSQLEDSGLLADGAAAAAAADDSGGGASSFISIFESIHLKVTCETACGAGQIQACATDAECNGGKCVPLSSLVPADAGVDAGALGGSAAGLLTSFGMINACTSADGGLPIDIGQFLPDASNDSSTTPDATGTTPDASPDAQ